MLLVGLAGSGEVSCCSKRCGRNGTVTGSLVEDA